MVPALVLVASSLYLLYFYIACLNTTFDITLSSVLFIGAFQAQLFITQGSQTQEYLSKTVYNIF